jgi:hypothetical protein
MSLGFGCSINEQLPVGLLEPLSHHLMERANTYLSTLISTNEVEPMSATTKASPPAPLDPLQRYSIPEANALLRQSNARTYEQIKAGQLRVIRDGGRTYIPGSEIVRRSALPTEAAP